MYAQALFYSREGSPHFNRKLDGMEEMHNGFGLLLQLGCGGERAHSRCVWDGKNPLDNMPIQEDQKVNFKPYTISK